MSAFSKTIFIAVFWLSLILQILLLPILVLLKFILSVAPKKDVLFLENFPVNNSGYYYRAEAWVDHLNRSGYSAQVKTVVDFDKRWDKLVNESFSQFLILSMWKRYFQLFSILRYETIIVRRELLFFNEYGNLFMDRILNLIHKNVILDIDDDLGASKGEPREINSWFGRVLLETGTKFHDSLKVYNRFICGSDYLKDLVLSVNESAEVIVIPTCSDIIDIDKNLSKKRVLGWIGGTHNLNTLDPIISILNELSVQFNFKLITISGAPYEPKRKAEFEIEHIQWNRDNDQENLARIDIGLMPLEDNRFTRGKCGFKLIQYMAQGIPSIGQNIPPNDKIIGDFGWVVNDLEGWKSALEEALSKPQNELDKLGKSAREHISANFSFASNFDRLKNFLGLINRVK